MVSVRMNRMSWLPRSRRKSARVTHKIDYHRGGYFGPRVRAALFALSGKIEERENIDLDGSERSREYFRDTATQTESEVL